MDEFVKAFQPMVITTIVIFIVSAATVWLAKKNGIGDLVQAANRESDRLVAAQAKRIELLEQRVAELEKELAEAVEREKNYISRIDALEELISEEQIRKLLHNRPVGRTR